MIAEQESMTAKLCSFARAYHSTMGKNKIFDDYLAYDIIGKEEYDRIGRLLRSDYAAEPYEPRYGFESVWVFNEMDRFFSPITLSRIAFAERALRRFAERHSESQYVVMGAGMDTFAFRNTDETIQTYELDHPDTQAYKLKRIQKLRWKIPENVHYAPVDFEKEEFDRPLLRAGFCPAGASFFSLLGVAYYLTPESFRRTVSGISALASSGSQFVFDFPDETTFAESRPVRVRELTEITSKLGEPMLHGFSVEEMHDILNSEGFQIRRHEGPGDIQRHFFDERTDNQRALENIHFLLAEKK